MAIPQYGLTSAFFNLTLSCIHPVALLSAIPVGDGGAMGPHTAPQTHTSRQLQALTPQPPSQSKAVFSLSSTAFWKGKKLRTHGVLLYVQAVRLMLQTGLAQIGPKVPSGHTRSPAFPKYRLQPFKEPATRSECYLTKPMPLCTLHASPQAHASCPSWCKCSLMAPRNPPLVFL